MESLITQAQWEAWSLEGKWTLLPCAVQYRPKGSLPMHWLRAWQEAEPYSFVLESGKGGRYTFLGLNPVSVIRGKGSKAVVQNFGPQRETGHSTEAMERVGKPLELLQEWMKPFCSPCVPILPKFSGGAVGFLGYDIARSLERLPQEATDDLGLDDYVWMRFEEIWVWDQEDKTLYAIVYRRTPNLPAVPEAHLAAENRAFEMIKQWERISSSNLEFAAEVSNRKDPLLPQSGDTEGLLEPISTSMSQEEFEAAVRRIQEYIGAGDVFQVNLSLRQAFRVQASPEVVYEHLRSVNPSPYMGLLRFPDFQLVSASPELLVKLEQGRISSRPIAGTRRRGLTEEEDALMAAELSGNEKERAEHIMLVDLLRNDLGRVAEYGTVRVSELLCIERYSHVMHLVSEVEGRLPSDKNAFDAIAAVFPGGTITGAPKIRTMEIIEELEPVTRGPYTGSMGWIDYNGNMELNIIIRTLVVKDGIGYLQAGAGIVIDSVPYREYKECKNKAKAVAVALRHSEYHASSGEGQGMKK